MIMRSNSCYIGVVASSPPSSSPPHPLQSSILYHPLLLSSLPILFVPIIFSSPNSYSILLIFLPLPSSQFRLSIFCIQSLYPFPSISLSTSFHPLSLISPPSSPSSPYNSVLSSPFSHSSFIRLSLSPFSLPSPTRILPK